MRNRAFTACSPNIYQSCNARAFFQRIIGVSIFYNRTNMFQHDIAFGLVGSIDGEIDSILFRHIFPSSVMNSADVYCITSCNFDIFYIFSSSQIYSCSIETAAVLHQRAVRCNSYSAFFCTRYCPVAVLGFVELRIADVSSQFYIRSRVNRNLAIFGSATDKFHMNRIVRLDAGIVGIADAF